MGTIFKKQRKIEETVDNRKMMLEKITVSCRKIKLVWAKWMGKRTAKFSRGHWQLAFALFVFFAGGYNLYLIADSFISEDKVLFHVSAIEKSKYITGTGDEQYHRADQLIEGEYQRINRFQWYMDSLEASPTGKKMYDSIVFHRPGLMDSIWFLKKYYRTKK